MSAALSGVIAAVILLAACGTEGTAPAGDTAQPTSRPASSATAAVSGIGPVVRVEYPHPGGPVTVRAVPVGRITPACVGRPGVVRVVDGRGGIGYAEAAALDVPAKLPACT